MKRFKYLALTMLMALVSTSSLMAEYDDDYYGGNVCIDNVFYRITSDTTCAISFEYINDWGDRYGSGFYRSVYYSGYFTIPSEITHEGKKYTVTGIDNYTFWGCPSLWRVTIPETVTWIGERAFSDCTGLNSMSIPESVTSIGASAFQGCTNISSVYLPENIKTIGSHTFFGCTKLSSVNIPENVTSIGNSAFYNCSSLRTINLPEAITRINTTTFYGCYSLQSIDIPEAVTYIGSSAFSGCSSLQEIVLPEAVTTIESYAFKGCSQLKSMVIPEGVDAINYYVFQGCTNLASVTLHDNITWIGGGAFKDCSSLLAINLPEGIKEIPNSAFQNCKSLASITVPETVMGIADYAFQGCSSLASVTLPNSITILGSSAFDGCRSLSNFVIPELVTCIYFSTFKDCISLTSINIPQGVMNIYSSAFYGCENLATVYNYSDLPIEIGSTDYGYVGYYATEIVKEKFEIYNGTSDFVRAMTEEEVVAKTTTPNAIIVCKGANELHDNYVHNHKANRINLTDAQVFYCPMDITAETLTYTRNFKNTSWQALYVPFDMEYSEWADKCKIAYINNVHQYDEDEDGNPDRTVLEFITKQSGTIKANTPYMIKPLETGEMVFELENKTLAATAEDGYVDCRSTTFEYTITGTYQPKSDMYANGSYALSNGNFIQANSPGVTLSPFRIFLDVAARSGNGALRKPQRVEVMVDGQTTSLSPTSYSGEGDGSVYNLSGQKVSSSYRGLVIKNGRKYINK